MFTSIAIIGRPNVGKSTLFNKLTRSRKAIVSDFSGLTKDRNYGYITFGDQKTLLIDTGGIAQDETILKEDIAEQAWIAAEESSLIIFLLDGSENLNKEDLDILSSLRKLNKKFITVLNKIDKKTDKILGAHIIGHDAGQLIAEIVTTIEFGGSAEDIARVCHAHPTTSEAVKEAALSVDGRAIHI